MRGLGDAILTGETLIGEQPFGVILADDLCVGDPQGVMAQMVRVFEKYQCSVVAVEEVPFEDVDKYGIVSGVRLDDEHLRVDRMVEKPAPEDAPSNLAVIGRYILTPDIFDILRNTPQASSNASTSSCWGCAPANRPASAHTGVRQRQGRSNPALSPLRLRLR